MTDSTNDNTIKTPEYSGAVAVFGIPRYVGDEDYVVMKPVLGWAMDGTPLILHGTRMRRADDPDVVRDHGELYEVRKPLTGPDITKRMLEVLFFEPSPSTAGYSMSDEIVMKMLNEVSRAGIEEMFREVITKEVRAVARKAVNS